MTVRSPILLIVFNRPDTTRQVFDAVRRARPAELYVAADGARTGRPEEALLCSQVREITQNIDWPCTLHTLFRDENLGCGRAVSGAIDWFFENVEQGVILEDDCLPEPSFFTYCDDLLDYYSDAPDIAQICGSSFVDGARNGESYYYSKYADIWGWASWRRSWENMDIAMTDWPKWRDNGGLESLPGSTLAFVQYWTKIFNATHAGLVDTWDYQWMFKCWQIGALSVMPESMLIKNLGFDDDATHTIGSQPDYVVETQPINTDWVHPEQKIVSSAIEKKIAKRRYYINKMTEISTFVETIPMVGPKTVAAAKYLLRR